MDKNHNSRPRKEAQVIGRIFGQKASFLIEELGSKVQGSKVIFSSPCAIYLAFCSRKLTASIFPIDVEHGTWQ